jgi:hypothetical protein
LEKGRCLGSYWNRVEGSYYRFGLVNMTVVKCFVL